MKNKILLSTLGLLLAVSLVAIGCPAPAPAPPVPTEHNLTMATSPPPSIYYTAGILTSQIMTKYGKNIDVSVGGMPGGGNAHIRRALKHQVDLFVVNLANLQWAVLGLRDWTDNPVPDLRLLYTSFWNPMHLVVRADSGIETLEQMDGQPFGPGFLGTSTADIIIDCFDALGIKPKYTEASLGDLVNSVRDKRLVGVVTSSTLSAPPPAFQELMATTELRPVGFTEEQKKIIQKLYPYFNWYTIPAGVYPGQESDVIFVGSELGWAVLKEFPEEAAYEMTKAVNEHFEELTDVMPGFAGYRIPEFTLKAAGETSTVLHPGTIRYFRELGYTIPEQCVPPEIK